MYLGETKEVRTVISDVEYVHLHELPIDIARREFRANHIHTSNWNNWYGVRLAKENDEYVAYSRVHIDWSVEIG